MRPPFPSFTAEWHNDTYSAIDPQRPELSLKGKNVVITGGGVGIGRGTTEAFAAAGATTIAILGRRQAPLEETKHQISKQYPSITVSTHVADVTDMRAIQAAAKEIGAWDILVSNAGYIPQPALVEAADENDWWQTFEINVKGSFYVTKAFLPTHNPHATIISTNAGSIQVSGAYSAKNSAYNSSKFAMLKLFEIVAVENPSVHVVSMHPGVIATAMHEKGEMKSPSVDTIELPAHFAVWLCSEEAKFLRGRFVWANWDVEQMIAKKDEIAKSLLLTANCVGWPFNA